MGEKETNRERKCAREREKVCERKYVWVKIALKSVHVALFSHQHHVKIRTYLKQMFFQKYFVVVHYIAVYQLPAIDFVCLSE